MKSLTLICSLLCLSFALTILYIEFSIYDMNKKTKNSIELSEIISNYISTSITKIEFNEIYHYIKYDQREKFKKCDQKFILNFILLYLNNYYK